MLILPVNSDMTKKFPSSVRLKFISFAAVLLLVGIDQLIKYFVVAYLKPIGTFEFIPGFLHFTYVENDGAMLGMMGGKTVFMTVAALVCAVAIIVAFIFIKVKLSVEYVCFSLILAGGIGNIIDRVARGFVVDYIEAVFVDFYVFNFADCLITCSAIVMIVYEIYCIFKRKED